MDYYVSLNYTPFSNLSLASFIAISMYRLNSIDDRLQPCLTPFLIVYFFSCLSVRYGTIYVCSDYLTRYAVIKAVPKTEISDLATFTMEEIVFRRGAPRTIIIDRGTVSQSRLILEVNRMCEITHQILKRVGLLIG